jgi:zinc transport system permease protein
MLVEWMNQFVLSTARLFHVEAFEVRAVLALLMVALACGTLGSLVIGNRMAFFSDAMAHTAMAGVTLALLLLVVALNIRSTKEADEYLWILPVAMATVGVVVGLFIAVIQERTALSSDTVIGVFFALSLGFAGLLLPGLRSRINLELEGILFGQLIMINDQQLLITIGTCLVTCGIVGWKYNSFLLGSFNPSLANSRGLNVRWNNYLFVVLLALVVNLSIYSVGVLLINALLVVPAAAAANVSRNLRRMFWFTLGGCVACSLVGLYFSSTTILALGSLELPVGPSGAVVVACVGWFLVSLVLRAIRRRFFGAPVPCPHTSCSHTHESGEYHHAH